MIQAAESARRYSPLQWLPQGKAAERAFLWIFGLSMLLRLVALAILGNGPFRVSDEGDYVDSARVMLSGVHFTPYWSPGLPLFLTPLVAGGASNLALRAFMLVFWVVLVWALWRLCRALAITDFAWLILLIFAILPDSIQLSVEVQTEQVVAALLLLAVSAAVRAGLGAGLAEYALLGCSSAMMALVRPSALPLVFLLPLAAFVLARGVAWPRRLAGPVLSVVLGGALVFGWMIRAHQLCGAWIVNTSNAVNLYYGNNPWTPTYRTWYFGSHAKLDDPAILNFPEYRAILEQAQQLPGGVTGLAANKYFQKLAVAEIVHHPGRFLVRDASRVRCYFGFDDFTAANFHGFGGTAARLVPETLALEARCLPGDCGSGFLLPGGGAGRVLATAGDLAGPGHSAVLRRSLLAQQVPSDVSLPNTGADGGAGGHGLDVNARPDNPLGARMGRAGRPGRDPGGVGLPDGEFHPRLTASALTGCQVRGSGIYWRRRPAH